MSREPPLAMLGATTDDSVGQGGTVTRDTTIQCTARVCVEAPARPRTVGLDLARWGGGAEAGWV